MGMSEVSRTCLQISIPLRLGRLKSRRTKSKLPLRIALGARAPSEIWEDLKPSRERVSCKSPAMLGSSSTIRMRLKVTPPLKHYGNNSRSEKKSQAIGKKK